MSSRVSRRVHFSGQKDTSSQKQIKSAETRGRRKRRAWDATVSDLSVHKLSKDELERRHKSFQSKNAELAKHELYERAKENYDLDSSGNLRPSPLATRGGGFLRSLQGKELHEVLAESDKALRVVKDMFGDDPMRYTCQPNVTVAPHIVKNKANLERTVLESQRDEPPPTAMASPGGIRDESILELAPRKPALNELPSPQNAQDDDGAMNESLDSTLTPHLTPQGRGYKSALDLKRFQALIVREENTAKVTSNHPLAQPDLTSDPSKKSDLGPTTSIPSKPVTKKVKPPTIPAKTQEGAFEGNKLPQDPPRPTLSVHVSTGEGAGTEDSESLSGLSDISSIPGAHLEGGEERTVDVTVESDASVVLGKGTGPFTRPPLPDHPLHVAHKMTPAVTQETTDRIHGELEELEKLVHNLNQELHEYERSTSHTPSPPTHSHPTNGTLTRITFSLLTSVTKITHYLRESESQLKGEVEVRGHLLQTMSEQQNLMDALTSDVVKLQKENSKLKKDLKMAQHSTSEQILSMQKEISDLHKKMSTLALQSLPHWSNIPSSAAQSQAAESSILPKDTSITKPEQGATVMTSLETQIPETTSAQYTPNTSVSHGQFLHSSQPIQAYSLASSQPIHTITASIPNFSTQPPKYSQSTQSAPANHLPSSQTGSLSSMHILQNPNIHHVSSSQRVEGGLSSPYIQAQQSPLSYVDTVSHTSSPEPSILTDSHGRAQRNNSEQVRNEQFSQDSPFKELTPSVPPQATSDCDYHKDTLTLDSSYAPPPPPLSLALLVPALSKSELTVSAPSLANGINYTTDLEFDVAGFLSSLGKLEGKEEKSEPASLTGPHANATTTPAKTVNTSATVQSTCTSHTLTSLAPSNSFSVQTATNTSAQTVKTNNLQQAPQATLPSALTSSHQAIACTSTTSAPNVQTDHPAHHTLQAPDLSVSLFSTGSTEQQEGSLNVDPTHSTKERGESGTRHSSSDSKLSHGHQTKSQGGWFALTSQIAHQ